MRNTQFVKCNIELFNYNKTIYIRYNILQK